MDNITKNDKNDDKDLKKSLSTFIDPDKKKKECVGEECLIVNNDEIVERVEKKLITNDGRQLLI